MITSKELSNFQQRCHEYYTCFSFAALGLENIADRFRPHAAADKNANLFLGSGYPDEGNLHARILLKDAVAYSEKDGVFSDTVAKSILVVMYTEWDEIFRPKIAVEFGVETKNIACDLMGDLRL